MRTLPLAKAFLLTLPLALLACTPSGGTGTSSSSSSSSSIAMIPIVPGSQVHADMHVNEPQAGSAVESPLVVRGEARGTWYFEASFPVRVFDANGQQIAVAPAQAKGDWMTTDFVPFEVTLAFTSTTATGTLVLEKDNPSGESQFDAKVVVPVKFVP